MSYPDFCGQDKETERIVEQHANDFTYNTYADYVKKVGGFKAYVRSLGGIFKKWIDFSGKVTTIDEFAEVMNYVWGLYRIWGTDYSNGCEYDYEDNRWKAKCGNGGAFYPSKNPSARFNVNYAAWGFGNGTNLPTVEAMLSDSKNYAVVNCSQGILQAFKKAGLVPTSFPDPAEYPSYYKEHGYTYKIIRNASDLQVGDVLIFTTKKIPNRDTITNVPNWLENFFHTAIVGKRDSQYIYMFDSGHAFTYYGEPLNRRKIGDNQVYQWAADWIGLRYDCVAKLAKKFTGWKQKDGKWYYYVDDVKVTGWKKITWKNGTDWFYFDNNGVMQTGWRMLTWSKGTDWFYFDENGAMVKGWQKIKYQKKDCWFYFDSNGCMLKGLHYLAWGGVKNWYIFDGNGVMQTGNVKVNTKFGSHGMEGGVKV